MSINHYIKYKYKLFTSSTGSSLLIIFFIFKLIYLHKYPMARHSKNNTANCIFTYGERQKLKSMNEWGEVSSRIGADSQKKFEQCNLCLKRLEDPVACPKGHVFCKTCIIENLFMQKKEIKQKIKHWEEENNKKLNTSQSEIISSKIESLKRFEDDIVENEKDDKDTYKHLPAMVDSELSNDKHKMIEELKEKRRLLQNKEDKNELTKNCFWLPEKSSGNKSHSENKPLE
jgi:nitric oxide synthase-interacting protein